MDKLVLQGANLIAWLQKPAAVAYGIALLLCGYEFIFGGERGPQKAKTLLLGATIGMVIVMAAKVVADSISLSVKF